VARERRLVVKIEVTEESVGAGLGASRTTISVESAIKMYGAKRVAEALARAIDSSAALQQAFERLDFEEP